jgi:hypothetical protein
MKKRYLLFFLLSGLALMNGCLKEHSLENGSSPSVGTLQDDGTGDCLPKTVAGAYVAGTALVATANYIEVQVAVTTVGSYTIYTDTVNGMYFRSSGFFTTTGLNTVRLSGHGTPALPAISNFVVTYGTSGCTIAVTVSGSLGVFTLDGAPGGCMGAAVIGTYTAGNLLTSANTVTINVNVSVLGAYNISTAPSNGIVFNGSGIFTVTGSQAIVLSAAGSTPLAAGTTSIPVTTTGSACNFNVTVVAPAGAAVFTITNCATATVNGTYTVGTALVAATNTIGITVNVATAGTYTLTGTVNGMTFTASGTFAIGNGQAVTLAATSTSNPTTPGANIVPLTGATAVCNVTVNVNPGVAVAVFTVNCGSPTAVNGTYTQNVALVPATNTVTLSVNVITAGTYPAITTATTQGMTFASVAGTFAATGVQTVTLVGSGTPAASGTINIPVTAGTTPCSFVLLVVAPAALSDYFPRTTNSVWSYEFDDDPTDSVINKVIAPTHTALGNIYNIFMGNGGGGFDTAGFYRRSGNDYYHYVELSSYFQGALDIVQRVEFIFIKDNLATGGTWTTPAFANTTGGTPASVRIKFTIDNILPTFTIASSTGSITYPNTIVIKEEYEANFGTGWFSLTDQIGSYKDYYSKNIGWIKDEYYDVTGALSSKMEARRYIVY